MDFESLSETLLELEKSAIVFPQYNVGFLEIINKQNHETTNSSLYAYFINHSSSEIRSAFIIALQVLIKEKTQLSIEIEHCKAFTEVATSTGRIDIVLKDVYSSTTVIIENKIFHYLNNDLEEYWSYLQKDKPKKTIGILLSPFPHAIPPAVKEKYCNILHAEWMQKVFEIIDLEKLIDKNYIYLTDFYNTIQQFSTNLKMNEASKFYFNHAAQIDSAIKVKQEAVKFIEGQYDQIAANLGWQKYGDELFRRSFWDEKNHLDTYLTIQLSVEDKSRPTLAIWIELMREDTKKVKELNTQFKDHAQFQGMLNGHFKDIYYYFGALTYELKEEDLEQLAAFTLEKIRIDFADILIKIITKIYGEEKTKSWASNFKTDNSK